MLKVGQTVTISEEGRVLLKKSPFPDKANEETFVILSFVDGDLVMLGHATNIPLNEGTTALITPIVIHKRFVKEVPVDLNKQLLDLLGLDENSSAIQVVSELRPSTVGMSLAVTNLVLQYQSEVGNNDH